MGTFFNGGLYQSSYVPKNEWKSLDIKYKKQKI